MKYNLGRIFNTILHLPPKHSAQIFKMSSPSIYRHLKFTLLLLAVAMNRVQLVHFARKLYIYDTDGLKGCFYVTIVGQNVVSRAPIPVVNADNMLNSVVTLASQNV